MRFVLFLAAALSLGATGAGVDMTTEDRCQQYALHGITGAENLIDRCQSEAQGGRDDWTLVNGAICNQAHFPTHFESSQRSCLFDGDDNYMHLNGGLQASALTVAVWHFPFDAQRTGFITIDSSTTILRKTTGEAWAQGGGGISKGKNDALSDIFGQNFIAVSWSGVADTPIRLYTDNPNNANTLYDNTDENNANTDIAAMTTFRIGTFLPGVLTYNGFISQLYVADEELTACELCLVCRCSPANGYRDNGITGWKNDGYDNCNQCALCSGITHCGPRRTIN